MESQTTQEVAQTQKKFESLRTITPLSKYLAMALFIIMPFIGGWVGYVYAPDKVVEVEKVVLRENPKKEDQASSSDISAKIDASGMKVYESVDRVLHFSYPPQLTVSATTTGFLETPWGSSTTTYPEGSIDIPGLFIVSRVPYSQISEENKIYDYVSCCTGSRYWFDAVKSVWNAEKIVPTKYDENNKPLPQEVEMIPLMHGGVCSLVQEFGANKFYKIASGDEGVPTKYHYFLMTDKGYAIQFTTTFDLQGDYSSYADTHKPNPQMIQEAMQLLSSVVLSEGVSVISPACL